ncbi:MAG TPA: hypothetical protein VFS67_15805 [Polyangiaceae bacterium]|nr:hypothetical protein [Polyangiaceae bacterium]
MPDSKLGYTPDLAGTNSAESAQRILWVDEHGAADRFQVGDWIGHAEDLFRPTINGQRPTYVFPSGSSDIFLHLEIPDRSLPLQAILRFGTRQAPVPKTGVPFGAGVNYQYMLASYLSGAALYPPVEGFAYHLSLDSPRVSETEYSAISLSYSQDEAFGPWCLLQPSLPRANGGFDCLGSAGYAAGAFGTDRFCQVFLADGSTRDTDCNLVALCVTGVCECTADGCFANRATPEYDLWLAIEGDQLIGYLSGAVFEYGEAGHFMPIGAIRFDREEP